MLPKAYGEFFKEISSVHKYNTRLACKSPYYIHRARTNYGKFNIRFSSVTVWNEPDENFKGLSVKLFKSKLKERLLASYKGV